MRRTEEEIRKVAELRDLFIQEGLKTSVAIPLASTIPVKKLPLSSQRIADIVEANK